MSLNKAFPYYYLFIYLFIYLFCFQGGFRNAEYYKKATRMLRMYGPAVETFGQPIATKNIDLGDTNSNFVDGYKAKVYIMRVPAPRT